MAKNRRKAQEPRKRGRREWTTTSQKEFLTDQIPSYLAAQSGNSGKSRSDFWPPLWETYFTEWPLSLVSDEEKKEGKVDTKRWAKEKQRVKDWFNNHTRDSSSGQGKRKLLDLRPKKSKMLPDWQAYSRLYYDEKLKEVAEEEWPAERKDLLARKEEGGKDVKAPPEAAPLWFRNKIAMREFKDETNEVKEIVEKYRQSRLEVAADEETDEGVDEEEAKRIAKVKAYNKAQASIPQTLKRALHQLQQETGYVGFIALAGPDGQSGGEIKTIAMYSGKTPLGHDFGDLYTSTRWKEQVITPLRGFAEKVYPPHVRKTWALPVAEDESTTTSKRSTGNKPTADKKGKARLPAHNELESDEESEGYDNEDDDIEDEEDSDASDHIANTVASTGADRRNEAKRPSKAPSSRSHTTKTSTPPKLTSTDIYKDWDNGEALTPDERAEIMSLKSNYERAQAMNKRRNARLLKELELKQGVSDLLADLNATKPKKSSKATSKPTSTSQTMKTTMSAVARPTSTSSARKNPDPNGDSSLGKSTEKLENSQRLSPPGDKGLSLVVSHASSSRWPPWIHTALDKLEKYSDDSRWIGVLNLWLELEDKLGYPYGQSKAVLIDKEMRPDEIRVWLKSGRKLHAMPDITQTVDDFGTAWLKWWNHLQPEWRGEWPNFSYEAPEDGQWQELQKGGPNGFFIILLSYCWWGAHALTAQGEAINPAHKIWTEAFNDLEWVLNEIIEDLGDAQKRARDEDDEGEIAEPSSKRAKNM